MTGDTAGKQLDADWLYRPLFPKHWQRRSLLSLAYWVNGLAFRNIQFSPAAEGGKPVIKIAEIKGGITAQTKFTTQTFDDAVRVRAGDLLFSWSGQPETSIDAYRWRGREGWLNQHVFRVTPVDGVDTAFFNYLLRYLNPHFVAIAKNKQTTGLGHVTRRDLENMRVAVPPLPEQRAIGQMLGTLDEKIDLNRRMDDTLAAMARALFTSWFVDFEPVRAKLQGRDTGLPKRVADLFPDRFVGSNRGSNVPDGWQVGTLADVVEISNGGTPRTSVPEYWDGDIPWYTAKDAPSFNGVFAIDTERTLSDLGVAHSSTRLLPARTTVITARGTVGKIACLGVPMAMNQTCYGIRGRDGYPDFFTYWNLRASTRELPNLTHGTIFDTITRETFAVATTIIPSARVAATFDDLVAPYMERILANQRASRNLTALRDELLPKLISGELHVEDASPRLSEAGSADR